MAASATTTHAECGIVSYFRNILVVDQKRGVWSVGGDTNMGKQ